MFTDEFCLMCVQPSYRLAIRTEGMIEDLVKNLKTFQPEKTTIPELQMHCASAIFKVPMSVNESQIVEELV